MPDAPRIAVVAIVGSRDYPNADVRVGERLRMLVQDWPEWDWLVVSGGARGVDTEAIRAAERLKLRTHIIPADWRTHGKGAGFLRNQQIVDEVPPAERGNPSRVIAFWDFKSNGTRDTIRKSVLNGRATEIWDGEGEPAGHEAAKEVFGETAY